MVPFGVHGHIYIYIIIIIYNYIYIYNYNYIHNYRYIFWAIIMLFRKINVQNVSTCIFAKCDIFLMQCK